MKFLRLPVRLVILEKPYYIYTLKVGTYSQTTINLKILSPNIFIICVVCNGNIGT